jgi:hypothetical protein
MMGPSSTTGTACAALCAWLALGGCSSWRGDESEVSTVGDPYVVTGFIPILGDHDAPFPAMTFGRSGSRPLTIPGLFDRGPLAEDFLKHQSLEEKRIAAGCAPPQTEELPALPSTMDRVGSPTRGYVQKEFERYAVAYTALTQYPFYHTVEIANSGFAPELAVRCFRVARYDTRANEIRFDLIFQLRLDSFASGASSYRDAVQIRPLRAYFRKGSYEENRSGDKVSVSASIAIEATWFDQNRGYSETVLNYVFLHPQTFEAREDGDHFRYFGWDPRAGDFTSDWSGIERLPLPPVSSGLAPSKPEAASGDALARDSGRRAPPVVFRVTVAEATRVPAELKLVGDLVAPTADLTDIMTGVVKKTLRFPF